MRSSSILTNLITLASTVGSPSTTSTAFPITDTDVIPTTCMASGQCRSEDPGGTTTDLPATSCPSCTFAYGPLHSLPADQTVVPIRETETTINMPTGSSKSDTSSPPTGGNPTSAGASGGGATTKSSSTPTSGTGTTTKSDSTPTGGTGSGSGSGSGGSSGGTIAPAATTTAPGGSTGVAARNSGCIVAVVLLGSLVALLGSR